MTKPTAEELKHAIRELYKIKPEKQIVRFGNGDHRLVPESELEWDEVKFIQKRLGHVLDLFGYEPVAKVDLG